MIQEMLTLPKCEADRYSVAVRTELTAGLRMSLKSLPCGLVVGKSLMYCTL